jgi:4-amino-4-deoxy-L-arabinose transferase-like glycosyltransferase
MLDTPRSFFGASRLVLTISLFLLFGLGFAIRTYDITDLPLDFHPTRQLFSAIKARGMYYQATPGVPAWQRDMAVQMWKTKVTIEPEILPRLAAFLYHFTGEQLWVPRMLSACFWLIGGIFLFLLARDMVATDGAVLSLAIYLFTPYGITASRSFQPDPMMVMSILAFWWLVRCWAKGPAWKWAILAGLAGGFAIFVKLVAAFFVIGGGLGALFGRFRFRDLLRNTQLWTMAILGILPGAIWTLYGLFIANFLKNEFAGNFIPSLLVSPAFYLQWQTNTAVVVGSVGIALGLLGLFFIGDRSTASFMIGIWSAYLVFGFYFNYHISTHDYYSLPLIPIVALSLVPFGGWCFKRLADASQRPWMRAAVYLILLYGAGASLWVVRNGMKSVDYRPTQAYWVGISRTLGQQASIIALTDDYGSGLEYWGWQNAAAWPPSDQLNYRDVRGGKYDLDTMFAERTKGKDFFLVSDLVDFERQPDLKRRLYENYPVFSEGDGYVIFDLAHPYGGQS